MTVRKRIEELEVEHLQILMNDLEEYAKAVGMNLSIQHELYDEQNQCPWPWLGTFIDVTGNVIPCCRVANADICSFGNLKEQSFDEIWKSDGYNHLREQIRTNDIPVFCDSCYKADFIKTHGKEERFQN
jgi:radical SAM protein with 4Fe4S-binding SPASM domain